MNRLLISPSYLSFFVATPALNQAPIPTSCPSFHATVQFHYRELFPDANQGGKIVAAPGIKRENLPSTQLLSRQAKPGSAREGPGFISRILRSSRKT
jgi:hypothetical protein